MTATPTMLTFAQEYLAFRRALGFTLGSPGQEVLLFARWADRIGHTGPLTTELIVRWAQQTPRPSPRYWAWRFEAVRLFARHRALSDPQTEVPPAGLLGPKFRRACPHIYSSAEITALLAAARTLRPGLRPHTYVALFGLLIATGLRVGEALALCQADVDLEQGLLTLRKAKVGQSRLVPLHPSTTAALQRYVLVRDRLQVRRRTEAFFVTVRGTDIDAHIATLATYLGHVNVTYTYWYLTAVPELMAIGASRFETFAESGGRSCRRPRRSRRCCRTSFTSIWSDSDKQVRARWPATAMPSDCCSPTRTIDCTSRRRPSRWPTWTHHCCWRFSITSKASATMARGPATHVSRRCARFFHYAAVRDPTAPAVIPRALAIPTKCFDRPLLGFLSRAQLSALLAAPGRSTWSGHRDHVLFHHALQHRGARVGNHRRAGRRSRARTGRSCPPPRERTQRPNGAVVENHGQAPQ